MKRLKLIIGMLCASVFLVCLGLFAACGETDPGPSTPTYFTVTAEYAERRGSVKISAPESAQGYVMDESVTVTVTAKENFVVGEVKVNGAAATLDAQGKHTFKVAGNTTVSVSFYNTYDGWRDMVWTDSGYGSGDKTHAGLGTLVFTADGGMTLTPQGGEATPVVITTQGVDLAKDLPDGTIDVTVGGKAYKVSFGTGITFAENYITHVFDSPALTDFSEYEGEWTQHHNNPERAASLTITATKITYAYAGGYSTDQYAAYYTATDGTYYLKYQRTALSQPSRFPFGYLDNAKKVVYINMNGAQYFTADGVLPTAEFPAPFYGQWQNGNFGTFLITADEARIREHSTKAFAVVGAGEDATVYIYYNDLYYTLYLRDNAGTGEKELVLANGGKEDIFKAVKPQPLPSEFTGEWTQLGGTATISVDAAGKFTYQGKVYATTYDNNLDRWHFITDAGYTATVAVDLGGYVFTLDDGNDADRTISYFTKAAVDELPDLSVTGTIQDGTYTFDEGATITVTGGKMTLANGGEPAALRLLFGEITDMDDVRQYVGGAIWNNIYYGFKYNLSTGSITLQKNINLAAVLEAEMFSAMTFKRGGTAAAGSI